MFSYISQKIDFDILRKFSPKKGDNLLEMSKPIFLKKKKTKQKKTKKKKSSICRMVKFLQQNAKRYAIKLHICQTVLLVARSLLFAYLAMYRFPC